MLIFNFECNPLLKAYTLNWILLLRHSKLCWLQSKNIFCEGKKIKRKKKRPHPRTSLVVQWLRLCAPDAGDLGSIPGEGTGSYRPPWRSFVPQLRPENERESHSAVSDSLWPRGLYSPWDSPGQNTGVGSLSLLQGIFPTQESNPGLPHCRQILYQLSYKGSPTKTWHSQIIKYFKREGPIHQSFFFFFPTPTIFLPLYQILLLGREQQRSLGGNV